MNFYRLESMTATDSLLCPNTTYTFQCEISGNTLQLTSFDSSGSAVNGITAIPGNADAGTTVIRSEFNFTRLISADGLLAVTAVMDSSMNLTSVELECRDADDMNFTTLSTVVNRGMCDHLITCTFVNICDFFCDPCLSLV